MAWQSTNIERQLSSAPAVRLGPIAVSYGAVVEDRPVAPTAGDRWLAQFTLCGTKQSLPPGESRCSLWNTLPSYHLPSGMPQGPLVAIEVLHG